MKKIILGVCSAVFISCGSNTQSDETSNNKNVGVDSTNVQEVVEKICYKMYDEDNTEIRFGAFKTTEKKEVQGVFESFDIRNTYDGETAEEIFAKAEFMVYVNSLETNDAGRNQRIRESFFGIMGTDTLSGKVVAIENDSILVDLKMNALTQQIKLGYAATKDSVNLVGSINVLNWKGNKALEAMNKACYDLHKGADGISKTWPDVNLYISSKIKEVCE
jgi:hypothetical protein